MPAKKKVASGFIYVANLQIQTFPKQWFSHWDTSLRCQWQMSCGSWQCFCQIIFNGIFLYWWSSSKNFSPTYLETNKQIIINQNNIKCYYWFCWVTVLCVTKQIHFYILTLLHQWSKAPVPAAVVFHPLERSRYFGYEKFRMEKRKHL